MSLFIVDCESDGPAPGFYSMVCFGAVMVQRDLVKAPTFYGQTRPITEKYNPQALAVSGFTREQHMAFPRATQAMIDFAEWVKKNSIGRPVFMSDNPAYDFMWIAYYSVLAGIDNPFGFSGRRIGDFYAGLEKNFFAASEWKKFRKTKHTHNPVDDARGNAEALISIADQYKVKLPGIDTKY
jgi:hypothetical protein